jgi:hypothetical protein
MLSGPHGEFGSGKFSLKFEFPTNHWAETQNSNVSNFMIEEKTSE